MSNLHLVKHPVKSLCMSSDSGWKYSLEEAVLPTMVSSLLASVFYALITNVLQSLIKM